MEKTQGIKDEWDFLCHFHDNQNKITWIKKRKTNQH